MSKNILFIDNNQSFISRTISENLIRAGLGCTVCPADITQVNKQADAIDYIFLNLDEDMVQKTDFFVFLRDLCVEKDKRIFMVGYSEQLAKASIIISPNYIGGAYERPINVSDIVAKVTGAIDAADQIEEQKHILVVDDSGEMLRTVRSWLSDQYRVSMANSAVNAISFLSTNTPDLILLDYEMPVCSGPQMLEMIRSEIKTESIPVMFLTNKSDAASVKAVLALKPQGYILKSHSKEKILNTINEFFASQKN